MPNRKIVEKFNLGKKEVIFRYPKPEDWKGLLNTINLLIEERAMISIQKKKTKKEEIKWLTGELERIKNKKNVCLVVEINGKIKGSAGIALEEGEITGHTGELGIALLKEIRGKKIGKKLLKRIIKEAKEKLKIKIVKIRVAETNIVAQNLYKKIGFEKVGKIKKGMEYYGKYVNEIIMVKYV